MGQGSTVTRYQFPCLLISHPIFAEFERRMFRTYIFGPLHFINLRVGVYDAIKVDIRTLENIFPVQV